MADENQDRIIAQYIERIERLRQDRQGELSRQELHALAEEMGYTPAELQQAAEAAREHMARGKTLLQHRSHDEAIAELNAAVALAPLDAQPRSMLANAHAHAWQASRDSDHRKKALRLARESLELDPQDDVAAQVLEYVTRNASKKRRWIPAVLGIGALGAVGIMAGMWFTMSPAPPGAPPPGQVIVEPIAQPLAAEVETVAEGAEDLDVSLNDAEFFEGFNRRSQITSSTYVGGRAHGRLVLRNNGEAIEFVRARVLVETYDDRGNLLNNGYLEVLPDEAPLRPGEVRTVPIELETSKKAHRIALEIREVESQPAPESYPPQLPVELLWSATKPTGVEPTFEVLRDPESSLFAVAVENKGTRAMGSTQIELTCPPVDRRWNIAVNTYVGQKRWGKWRGSSYKYLPVETSERRVVFAGEMADWPDDISSCQARVILAKSGLGDHP